MYLPNIFWRERVMRMKERIFYVERSNQALEFAARELEMRGLTVAREPSDEVTHLVLGVPCRMDSTALKALLKRFSPEVRVYGGFPDREKPAGYRCLDLLTDEEYLARNAAITAHCALRLAMEQLPVTWEQCPVLILGWGRIGKCLAGMLKGLGAQVVIAVRKESQRAMLRALGYEAETLPFPNFILPRFRVIFNTVPEMVAPDLTQCRSDCVKLELASVPGMAGDNIINARALPGRFAPESSGKLIARTVSRLSGRKEDLV